MATKSAKRRRRAELQLGLKMKRGSNAWQRSPLHEFNPSPLTRTIGVSLETLLQHWPTVKYVFRNR